MNLQIYSSMQGMRKAKELGVSYLLKTRSDMRIYQIGSIDFLINVVEKTPVYDNRLGLKKRIIAGDFRCLGTQFWPFFLGDQWSFGIVEDMLTYWNMSQIDQKDYDLQYLQTKDISGRSRFTKKERIQKGLLAEADIMIDFIKRATGESPEISIENYWNIVKKYFAVVDRRILDFYWYKYDIRYEENLHNGSYSRTDSREKCYTYTWNYLSWYNLYCGSRQYDKEYERFCETYFY